MQSDNFTNDLTTAIKEYPSLKLINEAGDLSLEGSIDLIHSETGIAYDSFSVKIYYPKQYPFCFPKVIETGGKIPRTADRHVNVTANNTLCLTVDPEERLLTLYGITTSWFIENVLLPRLGEEYIVNDGGKYLHEYSHNALGYWEFYFQKFNTKNPLVVINILENMLQHSMPKGYMPCICKSGKDYKKCHKKNVDDLYRLGTSYIQIQLNYLKNNKIQ